MARRRNSRCIKSDTIAPRYDSVDGKLYLGLRARLFGLGPDGVPSGLEQPSGHIPLRGVTGWACAYEQMPKYCKDKAGLSPLLHRSCFDCRLKQDDPTAQNDQETGYSLGLPVDFLCRNEML